MEFTEVMKHWRRMCDHYTTDDNESCCNDCPMRDLPYDDHGCDAIFSDWAKNADWGDVEAVVRSWAAEHPEPVYPTWREWLIKLGIVSFETDFRALLDTRPTTLANTVKAYINEEGSKPIPANIAQKLGIEPKGEAQ